MKKLIITGMPRSGTSWLGQIINSSPTVSFRTEPLFSYRFKNILNINSNGEEINNFFDRLINIDDDFILQNDKVSKGHYPAFDKTSHEILAFKTTRHFELLELYLESVKDIEIIAIIRHPCAVINSWFHSYREFEKKDCNKMHDWRTGQCRKNNETGEYWGFNDWIASTKLFLKLEKKYTNFHIVRYSSLVENTEKQTKDLFNKVGITVTEQTLEFIKNCHKHHDHNHYSVFKSKSVLNHWGKLVRRFYKRRNSSGSKRGKTRRVNK
ncbi:sulfotransferase family protein [Vreelandella lionensis]|uniref:sulfotransferase family protein n=1 Tax=Vreelandella lionensis TaxID=1144478 RepID=UPI0009F47F77|nr:sulfotransferase [Halomonas lionensis]